VIPRLMALAIRVGLFPILQRRLFFGVPLPPLDPAFSFRDAGPVNGGGPYMFQQRL